MKRVLVLLIVFFLMPMVNAVCIIPIEGMKIKEDAVFCSGTYNIENGIKVANNNVILDCNKSVLIGNGIGYGFFLNNVKNVVIRNCNITNYEAGIYLDNANDNIVKNNYLTKNKFGIALFNSFNNKIDDNVLFDNIRENTINLQSSLIQEGQATKEELIESKELISPEDIMQEVIKIKNPFLTEEQILDEVNFILDEYFNFTEENLEISRDVFYNETDRSTQIVLRLRPKKALLNLSVYEKIPKCVSNYVNEILFRTAGYEVVNDDPLILWTFARLDKESEISYKVFKSIDDECKNILVAFGIATGFEELEEKKKGESKTNYFIIALVIILFIFVLYYAKRKRKR